MATDLTRAMYRTRKPRRRFRWFGFFLLALLFAGSTYLGLYVWEQRHLDRSNTTYLIPHFSENEQPVFYQGNMLDMPARGAGDSLQLPLPIVKQFIDPSIHFDDESLSVIITTAKKVIQFKTDQLTGMMNEQPFELRFSVELIDDVVYLPIAPLRELYGIDVRESPDTGAVFIAKEGDIVLWGKVSEIDPPANGQDPPEQTVAMRAEASTQAPIVADLHPEDRVMIWHDAGEWYEVQLMNGFSGYVAKASLSLEQPQVIPRVEQEQAFIPWKPVGGKVVMTWEAVENRNPDTSKIGEMAGLNVISPTWFSLLDGEGTIRNMADSAYVNWAHARGLQVWALFSNGFDPERTTQALATYDLRMGMIRQLVSFVKMYNLQGINLDFENVYLKDKDNLTQFVRELTPYLHEQGAVVSIDVTFKSSSELWSMFYDRPALSQIVDYMMIMAYDEHYAASPISGSVASLPWVETSLVRIMEEDGVPASKIVLGVPYYTREWTEEKVDGTTKVSSRAIFMDTAQTIIKDKNLTPVFLEDIGQNYVEYTEGSKTFKIWIEDAVSMQARVELVRKYDLAGIASWRRGYENPNIWELIKGNLEKRP